MDAKFTGIVNVDTAPLVEQVVEKVPGAQKFIRLLHVRSPFWNTLVDVENDNVAAARRNEARVLGAVPEENESSVHASFT